MEVIQGPICKVYDLIPTYKSIAVDNRWKNVKSGFLVDQCGSLEELTF